MVYMALLRGIDCDGAGGLFSSVVDWGLAS